MNFSTIFCKYQGIFVNINNSFGSYEYINYIEGNEEQITKIIENLKHWLNRKHYLENNAVSLKHEMSVRKFVLFLILNTKIVNKSALNSTIIHLCNMIMPLSKYLLTHIVFDLKLEQYYAEAITSVPLTVSLELLENCNRYMIRSDPYLLLKQVSIVAKAIYYKAYHIRYEIIENINSLCTKLLDKFMESLKNYITPVTEKILKWKKGKMYQYMGIAIHEILNLLKSCFTLYYTEEFVSPFYQFYQFSSETFHPLIESTNTLDKSNNLLKEFNKHLFSLCESNIEAVSLDVFCAWVEYDLEGKTLQHAVGIAASEVIDQLEKFEDVATLSQMLSSIAVKPQTIEDKIKAADEDVLLENVQIESEQQIMWFKSLINYGVVHSEKIFNIFSSLTHLLDVETCTLLLSQINPKDVKMQFDLRTVLFDYFETLNEEEIIPIITNFYTINGFTNENNLETNFDMKFREIFNKLNSRTESCLAFKDISILILQNPIKFLTNLWEESKNNAAILHNILPVYAFIKPVYDLENMLQTFVLNKLKEFTITPSTSNCVKLLVTHLVNCDAISYTIYKDLHFILNDSIENNDMIRVAFICQLFKDLSNTIVPSDDYVSNILYLYNCMKKIRWNFYTYSEEKLLCLTEIVLLINYYKTNLPTELVDDLKRAVDNLTQSLNSYHCHCENISQQFLDYATNNDFNKNSNHNELVCRLVKLLPCCLPIEWELSATYLTSDKDPISVIKLFIDILLILSEISKKSCENHNSLSYCFQQFCIITKDIIYPTIHGNVNNEIFFIKNIIRLIKHLPKELHNTIEISLINLFNFDVLKSLKTDEDFVYTLVSISHLEICKIICSKMN